MLAPVMCTTRLRAQTGVGSFDSGGHVLRASPAPLGMTDVGAHKNSRALLGLDGAKPRHHTSKSNRNFFTSRSI